MPATVKLRKSSSPPSSTDTLHLAWILCALRRLLSSPPSLVRPRFVVYFIRYLREANPRFDADHPFSAIARFLAAATGEAGTLSDSTVQILVKEFAPSPTGKIAAVPTQRSCLRSHHAWTPSSPLACLAALTEATGINVAQVVDKAMKIGLTSSPEGTLAAVNKAVFRSGYKGRELMTRVVSSKHVAITACEDVAVTLYRVQSLCTEVLHRLYYGPLAVDSLAKLAMKRVKSRDFIHNPAEFVYISKFISALADTIFYHHHRHRDELFETTLAQIVKLVDGKSQGIFIRSKPRAAASIEPRMLGLISAVLRDRREFATAVEFIFTHPTLNVIIADKEEVFTARQLVQVAQMVSLSGVGGAAARSVMHRLLTSTERMNTFSVNEQTQRRKHCSKLATLFECCIPDCKASCWVYQSGYHIDVVLNIPKELNSSSSSRKSARQRGKLALGLWYLQPSQMYRTRDGKLLVRAEFSREFLLRTSKDIEALAFVTRDEADALLSNSRGRSSLRGSGRLLRAI
ncbi:hypothetical protein FOZ62_003140 [Perkinsus olseni]|uniref:Uncharacterized protein n=1 Tax=Perkinsus olseni TaxID=32597 RepID=A0A7J6QLA1_PEROL|nr:hypothetical protein FOZ62_003140 [Perkinsus olseni]